MGHVVARIRRSFLGAGFVILSVLPLSAEGVAQDVIIAHGISSFGDLKYGPDFAHFDYVNPDAPQGGTYVSRGTGASGTFDSLNPFILKGEPAQGLGILYDSLLIGSSDEPDSAYGYIAKSLEYPEDRSWVIFNMREEARFTDGQPITADDVVFSYNILMEKGHPGYRIIYKDVAAVTALGPHRVRFDFKEGVSTRDLPSTVGAMAILPEHYYKDVDFAQSTMTPAVTSGGFVVAEATPGRSIKYCKLPDYWAADLPYNVGTSNFECYVYEYFADSTAAFEAFKAGEYQFHEEFFSKLWATAYDFPALKEGWVVREVLPDGRLSGTQGFWINLRREKFQDLKTREAMQYFFNFEWSNETLFYGLYERTDSFWENGGEMQAQGLLEGEELALLAPYKSQLPASVFTEPAYVPPVLSASGRDREALRKAGELLDAAGWRMVDGQRVNDAGEVLTIEIMDDGPTFERIITPIIRNMERVGIKAELTIVDAAQYQQRQEDFDYDIVPGRLVMSMTPAEELAQLFGTEGAKTLGTLNLSGIAHPVVDDLIIQIAQAPDRETLNLRVRALDRVLRALHIWVPNWYKASHTVAYWDIYGRPEMKPPYARGVMETWWIDEAKLQALKDAGAL